MLHDAVAQRVVLKNLRAAAESRQRSMPFYSQATRHTCCCQNMYIHLQATFMGILSAAMFFVLSNAKPLEQLSARRPHPNIFCAYVFLSLLGQFAVHLVYLVLVWNAALATMPPV